MSGTLLLVACLLLSAAASYFLKLGAVSAAGQNGFLALAMHPMTLLGAACYAATFLLYALALQRVPLSLAQPVITAGASVVTVILAARMLNETMVYLNWLGVALVCVGIFLLFQGRG